MDKTALDLSGGLSPDHDLVLPGVPENPDLRESVSIWLFEENGAFAFPRMGVEAEASCWHDRLFQANFAFADGRVLNGAGRGAPPSPLGHDGQPRVIGAGAVTFACVEPFQRWTAHFDGTAIDGHVSQQIANTLDPQQRSPVRLALEMTMVTPAWVQDTAQDAVAGMSQEKAADAGFMGIGYRFEHLFRAQGTLHIDGQAREFRGSGLRIHRQSVRPLAGFRGHCWQSAVFPDGRAFGYIAYPPHEDGSPSYNEGYLYQDGRMIPARAVQIPWLRRIVGSGDDVALVLESALGLTRIEGASLLSTFRVGNPELLGGLSIQQGGALYGWDGQSAYGMIERSSPPGQTTIG
jgi:prepilin-type processing-associated H-X9-DG protein